MKTNKLALRVFLHSEMNVEQKLGMKERQGGIKPIRFARTLSTKKFST